jgi:hypothetical protein
MRPLTPQQQKIIDFLADGRWHCMADTFFMKDDRKRISELNKLGYEIIGMKCDRSCGKKHSSRVYMRKLKGSPTVEVKPKPTFYVRHPRTGERITTEELAML